VITQPSLDFYRILVIYIVCVFIYTNAQKNNIKYYSLFNKEINAFVILFLFYTVFSLSFLISLKYFYEIFACFIFYYSFRRIRIKINEATFYKFLVVIYFLFLLVNLFFELFLHEQIYWIEDYTSRVQGFYGVHRLKIINGIFLIILSNYWFVKRKRSLLYLLIVGVILQLLTLQRITIFATGLGISIGYLFIQKIIYKKNIKKSLSIIILSFSFIVITLLNYGPFLDRAFIYKNVTFQELITNLDKLSIYLNDSGRESMWKNYDYSFENRLFGSGLNSVTFTNSFFKIQNDLHNDYYKLVLEIGYSGLLIYLLIFYSIVKKTIIQLISCSNKLSVLFYSISLGIVIFYLVFGLADNGILNIMWFLPISFFFSILAKNNIN